MKNKNKLLATLAAATVLSVGAGVFGGCGHIHTYSDDWSKDETGHWHVATCDDLKEGDKEYKIDIASHDYGDDNECDVCHYKKAETETPDNQQSITINKSSLTLGVAKSEEQLTADVKGGGTVVWSTSDASIVEVNDETGYIAAGKPGKATITATISGTEISATCEVTVETAYYVIGDNNGWSQVGFGQASDAVLFKATATAGIYKTDSIELKKSAGFQIGVVGYTSTDDSDADVWWKHALTAGSVSPDDTVLSKGSGHISVAVRGRYTITLDLTGENPVVSGVLDETLPEEEIAYYLIGGFEDKNWQTAGTAEAAGNYLFTKHEDGTYTKSIELTKDTIFKVAIVGQA